MGRTRTPGRPARRRPNGVRHRGDGAGEAALVVVADHTLRDPAHHGGVRWGSPFAAHEFANMLVELVDQLSVG